MFKKGKNIKESDTIRKDLIGAKLWSWYDSREGNISNSNASKFFFFCFIIIMMVVMMMFLCGEQYKAWVEEIRVKSILGIGWWVKVCGNEEFVVTQILENVS